MDEEIHLLKKRKNNRILKLCFFAFRRRSLDCGGIERKDRVLHNFRSQQQSETMVVVSNGQKRTSDRLNSQNFSSCILQQVSKTMAAQVRGMTEEFKKSGLPWPGHECRSMVAGLSGILYCLPAFFCKSHSIVQYVWLIQALLSVLADYVYVDKDSWVHGIDRFVATANALAMLIWAASGLKFDIMMIGIVPISTFTLANRSKQQRNLQSWIYYHFLWHLTGSIGVAFVFHLLDNCPYYDGDSSNNNFLLDRFCLEAP